MAINQSVILSFPVTDLRKALSTSSATAAFAATDGKPTTTKPVASATRAVVDYDSPANRTKTTLKVIPYGGNDNNDQIKTKVIGWNRIAPRPQSGVDLWVSRVVCEVLGTLSNALTGVAGATIIATEFFCDTLSVTTGIAVLHQGTADIDTAWFECDTTPYEIVEIVCVLGTNGDASNALYGW